MQQILKHMTAEEINLFIKYAEEFKIKDFCASTYGFENIELDKIRIPSTKNSSKRKVATTR